MHADNAILADRGAVNDRAVSDGNIIFDQSRKSKIDVYNRVILNIAISADRDRGHVGSKNGSKPYTAIFGDGQIADKGSRISNEHRIMNVRFTATVQPERIELVLQRITPIIYERLLAKMIKGWEKDENNDFFEHS